MVLHRELLKTNDFDLSDFVNIFPVYWDWMELKTTIFFMPIDSIWSLRWSWSRTQRMKKTRKPKLWTHSQLFDLLVDSFVLSVFKFLDRSRDCKNVNFEIEFLNYNSFITSQQKIKIRSTQKKRQPMLGFS